MNLSFTKIATLVLVSTVPFLFGACPRNEKLAGPPARVSVATPTPTPAQIPSAFNGERAMAHAKKQIEFGPRPADTPALASTRKYIADELRSYGLLVSFDEFTADTPLGKKKMANIIGDLPGESRDVIIVSSHYDTKFYKDMTFVGANDPAASVATVLEIARVAASFGQKPMMTYRFVFFDGEEAFCENWTDCGDDENPDNTYGSRRYVSQLIAKKEVESTHAMILLDMMGYKNLELGRDETSTRWLQDIIWKTGRELGHTKIFVDRPEGIGGDDHEPFLKVGIAAVDIIQLNDYPYWHRADDTLDKISAKSMKIVGDAVLASLPKIADAKRPEKKRSSQQ